MSKLFLIVTSTRSTSNSWIAREQAIQEFGEQLEHRLADVEVDYTTYDDIECTVKDNEVVIYDTKHQRDLKDASLVHFKNWTADSEQAALMAYYLERHSIPFFNTEVNAGLAWGKIAQMVRLAYAQVTVPDTYYASNSYMKSRFDSGQVPAGFNFPLILKDDDGSKGDDNHLVQSASEVVEILTASPDKNYVIQNFLPNDGDYRFLFMGIQDQPLVFHRQAVSGSHLNNTSKGGQGSLINPAELPADYVLLARKAAEALHREISGVDILVDSATSKSYVLEVNATPAIATGYAQEQKNKMFANFLESQLEITEEE